jgi:cyclic beta-1,2-glucan synthetase
LLNPINHGGTQEQVQRYKVEPYVVAADVYSVAPHAGRGGWTWYTGAAGWMYRAGVEGILGIRREGDCIVVDPRLPATWPGFQATVSVDGTSYAIEVVGNSKPSAGVVQARLDGNALHVGANGIRVPLDGGQHALRLAL